MPRVAAVHAAPVFLDVAATIDKACRLIAEAGEQGAELVVFPEVFVPGFPAWINCYSPLAQIPLHLRYTEASVTADGPELQQVGRAARAAGTNVVLGINERDGGTLYNAQAMIDDRGTLLGIHRKLQPTFAERTIWGQGDGSTLSVHDTSVGRVGGLICWEHTMNLARQALIAQGMQIHAGSWPGLSAMNGWDFFDDQIDVLMRAHALSGQCYVVTAASPFTQEMISVMEDALGPQETMTAPGTAYSAIIEPMTGIVAGPERGSEDTILVADIDLGAIAATKLFADSTGHYGRPEVLSLHVDDTPKPAAQFTSAGASRPRPVAVPPVAEEHDHPHAARDAS